MQASRSILMGLILSSLVLSPTLQAQGVSDSARVEPVALDPIVVTATKVPVPAVTAATTVLRGESLRERGITRVSDALRTVPGLAVVQAGSFGGQTSLFLRGGESGYTRVLVDGVPVNDPGGAFNLAYLTTENIDRIEIVRGPTSVLYGTDAVTGVIQIFTRRGEGSPSARAEVSGGNLGTAAFSGGVSGSTEAASYAFDAARYTTDGIYDFNNEYDRTTLSGSIRLQPDDRTFARLSLQYADDEAHIPTNSAGVAVDRNAFNYGQRLTAGLEVGRHFGPDVDARVLITSHTTDGGFNDLQDGPADTLGFFASIGLDHVVRRGVDARANAYLSPSVVLTGGAFVEDERQRSFGESDSEFGPDNSSFEVSRATRGGYLQAVGAFERLSWNASGRLDDNDTFGAFWTWRLGLAYTFPTRTKLRAAAGTAFREPTFFQNFATGFVRGNPDLDPERTKGWEAGVDQLLWHGRLSLSATYFHQAFRDLIEFTFAPPGPDDPNYFNVAAARARGVELSARVAVPAGFVASASHTRLDTEVTEAGFDQSGTGLFVPGVQLVRRPQSTTTLGLEWRDDRMSFSTQTLYFGSRDDLDFGVGRRVVLDAYTTVDVAGSVVVFPRAPGRPGVTATFRLANAFGEEYQAVLGFRSPGRTLQGGVRVDW